MTEEERMTPEQQKCDEEVGHQYQHVPYEPDTNAGGYMECKLCGFTCSDNGFEDGFDDDYT